MPFATPHIDVSVTNGPSEVMALAPGGPDLENGNNSSPSVLSVSWFLKNVFAQVKYIFQTSCETTLLQNKFIYLNVVEKMVCWAVGNSKNSEGTNWLSKLLV